MKKIFLTAEWRKLAMANYAVDPSLLIRFLPSGTELDLWDSICYVSLVGFMFIDTRLIGFRIPFHTNFEEVNLRFYVRFKSGEWKRGVVFIKEIVPKRAITFFANHIYKERYETSRMGHRWEISADTLKVKYEWKQENWNTFGVTADNRFMEIPEASEEEFILEHYWGYTKLDNKRTSEYRVEHPRWQVYPVKDYLIDVAFASTYGPEFGFLTKDKPRSVFLAEGSKITVRQGSRI